MEDKERSLKKEILKERIAIPVFVTLFLLLENLVYRDYSTLARVACFVLAFILGIGFYLILVVVESAIEIKKEEKEKQKKIFEKEKQGGKNGYD